MLKEIDIFGVYIAPFAGYLVLALLIFLPVHHVFDRYTIQRWVWHRPLFDFCIFIIILSLIGLMF
jgi:hypothetical protein